MVEPRAVAVLALHVMIRLVRYLEVTGRTGRQIAVLAHRVTADAATLVDGLRQRLEVGPGLGVFSLLPISLVLDVAVAAVGLLRGGVEVAEEAGGRIRWRGERWPVSEDRVGATNEYQQRDQGWGPGLTEVI